MHKCPAAMLLYNNLRQEQTAVLGFMLNVDTVRPFPPLQYTNAPCTLH